MEKNLQNEEALTKFTKLAREINICMFITNNREQAHTRPMATIEAEENGTLWFFTDKRSLKVDEVQKEQEVHLTYAHPGKESYMDVWGNASLVTEKKQLEDKWSPIVKAWFPNGVEDPNLALLRIVPTHVYYWESESGKMVKFFNMAVAAVTGDPKIADASEGTLSV